MNFLPYEDVPLYLATSGHSGNYIFAESASLSINQPMSVNRQLDDQVLQICEYGLGSSMNYSETTFVANAEFDATLGPIKGPPKPLATSIYKIPSGSKITFPSGKHLFFADDIFPNGHDNLVKLYAASGDWSLTPEEAQSGYFEPIFNYSAQGAVEGSLSVNFYVNTGNLPSFFNITGLSNPSLYPPIDEEKITGFLGNFRFSDAYLTQFKFSISPNSISQASASFKVFGELVHDDSIVDSYYASDLYVQQSIPHGMHSEIIGSSSLDMDHPISFSYSIDVGRNARYSTPTGSSLDNVGLVPDRVSKSTTKISMTMDGENLDPNILSDGFNGKRANLKAILKDLSYVDFEDNSNGLLHTFNCSGIIVSQNLSVNSAGYLNGSISVNQRLK